MLSSIPPLKLPPLAFESIVSSIVVKYRQTSLFFSIGPSHWSLLKAMIHFFSPSIEMLPSMSKFFENHRVLAVYFNCWCTPNSSSCSRVLQKLIFNFLWTIFFEGGLGTSPGFTVAAFLGLAFFFFVGVSLAFSRSFLVFLSSSGSFKIFHHF